MAQQTMPVIGFLNSQSLATFREPLVSFRQGLGETGHVEGQNVRIEYRWAEGRPERLPQLADDLVRREIAVIVATAASYAAVRRAGATSPVVATFGGDPVRQGLVASLNRPGGNVTGVSIITSALEAKRLELMHELLPNAPVVGVLLDANFSDPEGQLRQVQDTARATGQRIRTIPVARESDIDAAFATLVAAGATALVVTGSPFLNARRGQVISLAARHRLAAIYENRESVTEGGLMSYGTSIPRVYHQLGIYTGRVLQGAKPAELPIVQPTKLDIAVNLKTAKTLGLDIPTSILLRADEVVE
jgi:putative ABC transport system substrate-binding protein